MPRTFGSLRAYEPGLMDKARWWMQDTLTPAFGGDAKAAGAYVNDKIMPTAEWLPGIGDAMAAGDAVDYFRQGSPMLGSLSALGAAAGLVPGVGDVAQKGIKGLVGGLEKSAKSKGVDLFLSPRGKNVAISKIVVPENMRNQGVGSSVMQEIIDTADANQLNLSLSPTADFGGNRTKLDKFYKRFGFEPNKGGTRDFEISETMRRYAKQPQTPVKTQGIRAYHGSPHSFDKFSMENIGTGEGAQAYGHGLYFAENEDVAREYRRALQHKAGLEIENISDVDIDRLIGSSDMPALSYMNLKKALKLNAGNYDGAMAFLKKFRKLAPPHEINNWDNAIKRLDEINKKGGRFKTTDTMYEVNINADPEQFLDWDMPLSEQPGIRDRLLDLGRAPKENVARLKAQRDALIEQQPPYNLDDLFSEPVGDGWTEIGRLNIEIADAEKALEKNAGALYSDNLNMDFLNSTRGSGLARGSKTADAHDLLNITNDAELSGKLKEAGIPGIKYLDQGSRGAGDGTRNYVVFDDSLVEILRKYGLVPGMLGAGALANMQSGDGA